MIWLIWELIKGLKNLAVYIFRYFYPPRATQMRKLPKTPTYKKQVLLVQKVEFPAHVKESSSLNSKARKHGANLRVNAW